MKIRATCDECFTAAFANAGGDPDVLAAALTDCDVFTEITHSGLIQVECGKGHVGHVVLRAQLFQILFDLAILAHIDGYPREAITGFAASLERFFEFVIRVGLRKSGLATPEIDSTWRLMSKQSERQLGAYSFMLASILGRAPPHLGNPLVSLRNDVIHKGFIPPAADVERFANEVVRVMREVSAALWPAHNGWAQLEIADNMKSAHAQRSSDAPMVGYMHLTAIEMNAPSPPSIPNFSDAVEHVRRYRNLNYRT